MSKTNDRTNWERRLAGEVIPIIDGEPDYGFYRVRSRDRQNWEAVAYWYGDDGIICSLRANHPLSEQDANELWSFACKHPITYEVYRAVMAGEPWPDLHPSVTRDNQAPPDNSFEALKDRIEDIAREADKITDIPDQAAADSAADLKNKLGELQNAADRERAAEKKPHDDAAKEVQAKWKPIIDVAEAAKRRIASVIGKFLGAKEAASRAAREEAAKAGVELEPQPRASITKAGTRGRAVALRTVKDVAIADRAAVLAFFAEGQAMTEFLQSQAEKAVRAGVAVPGVTITERKVAA